MNDAQFEQLLSRFYNNIARYFVPLFGSRSLDSFYLMFNKCMYDLHKCKLKIITSSSLRVLKNLSST